MPSNCPKIVVIGGGTGSFTLLSALRRHNVDLTALVSMADNGGSTGVLRDELGVLPPGDIRQCLVALSTAPEELRELFNYRFPEGTFSGHSFGNLFLSAVEKMTDDFNDAVRMAGDVLRIHGHVLPTTLTKCNLVMQNGKQKVVGEYKITNEHFDLNERPNLSLAPKALITLEAKQAILSADLVVVAPGNLYGSIAPALLVSGVGEALKATKAKVVFVCNLVNKPNHTKGFTVTDYAEEIERFAGDKVLDYVLYNTDEPDPRLLAMYALDYELPVIINKSNFRAQSYLAIGGHFLSRAHQARNKDDKLIKRSLIRHDINTIAISLIKLIPKA
jgi:uncharacterized cofD-like protein